MFGSKDSDSAVPGFTRFRPRTRILILVFGIVSILAAVFLFFTDYPRIDVVCLFMAGVFYVLLAAAGIPKTLVD